MRSASDQKSDGLEIVSIGKLYTGPWEKKYWSSSRGKDRYPFPIEFSAVRMQNGITYKMEISEGLKGPLFKISSSDGLSCSGQTPGVAWESFQKKSSSQIKSGHGKRFSCKIDGLEFFGFKNAFVQRFLRELVANVGTNAASNMLPSSISMDAAEVKDPTDTLPHLEKPQVRGRRSRKESVVTPASLSKMVKGSGENISDASSCKKRRQEKYNGEHSSINPIQKKDTEPSTSPRRTRTKKMKSVISKSLVEEQGLLHSAKDDLPSDAFHATDHRKVDESFLHEERYSSSSGNLSTVKEDRNLPKQEKPIDQKNVSAKCQSNILVIEDENKRTMCPKTACLSELVAPDSLDHFSEDSCKQKDIIANDMVSVKESELLQVDGNIPKPMLSIVVPQPIKAFSRRKRTKKNDYKPLEVSTPATITEKIETVACPVTTEDENDPNSNQNKKARISDNNPEDYIQNTTVAPDSFDGYDTGNLGYTKPHLLPEAAVDNLTLHQNKKDHKDYILTTSVAPDSIDGYDTECLGNAKPHLHPKDAVDDPSLHQNKDHEGYIQTTSVGPDSIDGYDTECLGNAKPHLHPKDAVNDPSLHQKKDHEGYIQTTSVAPDSFDGYDPASPRTTPHLLPNEAEDDPTLHQDKKDHEDYIQNISVAPDSIDGYDTESLRNSKPYLVPKDEVDDPTLHQKKDHEDYIQTISVAPDSIDGYDPESLENTKPHILSKDAANDSTLVCPDTCPNDSCFGLVKDSTRDTETTASKKDTHCTRTANSSKDSLCVGKEHARGDQDLPGSDIPTSHPLIQTESCTKPHLLPDDANLVCPDSCSDDAVEDSVINTETAASKTDIPCTTSLSKEFLCVGKEPEHNDQDLPDVSMPKSYPPIQTVSYLNDMSKNIEVKDSSTADGNLKLKHENGLEDLLELVACYNHPMQISSVLLSLVGNDMYICVLSGSLEEEDRTLFVYSTPITGDKRGRPFFVGYASVNLPKSEDTFGNKIAMDSSAIQFTPDGQDLVLLNSIKVPCCRDRNMNCPCPACASDCIEKNSIKIVQLNVGYVSVIIKLKTAQPVRCILVCELYYLVAICDTGKLHMWVMNSRWSAQKDECELPLPDNMPLQLVEIKKIPQSPGLIIGHNGFGQFCFWNIEKRKLVSRFSAPNLSIHKCVPVCLFDWQVRGSSLNERNKDEIITDILDATKMRLSGSDIQLAQPTDNKDGAVWVLLSGGHQMKSAGCWRLALLAKDTVILGDPLDKSATAAGASVGHGVIGRSDGVVYMWELSTGLQISDLHHFKGSGVSCIATDSSNSALAIASEGGQLLVYLNPRRASAKVKCSTVRVRF